MISLRRILLAGLSAALLAISISTPAQDPDERARQIVRQMTLDEKITELHGIREQTHYRYVPPIPRLGIPELRITNGPAGAGPDGAGPQAPATALPSPIAIAATWDIEMARLDGEIAGAESRDLGNGLLEAPTINIARVPQNGRTFEGYGEDPYLAGQISACNIQGIQSQGVIADVKHFAANNQETDRSVINEVIDERTLREIYLPAFEASIRQGHSAAVMCAYPRVNGPFCCENDLLMNQILKREWAFDGFVTSDFGATHSTAPSALAGLDLEMPTGQYFSEDLKKAVETGQVPVSVLDDKLIRRFRTMMKFGIFDHPPQPQTIPAQQDGAAARKLATAGIVLLKNTGRALPLNAARLKSIAVIGPYADGAMTGGGGSSRVVPLYTVAPVDGIQKRAGANVRVSFSDGADAAKAAALAREADTAIVMVGATDTEGRDHGLTLGANQDTLVEAVAAANRRTVVVLKTGSAVMMPWLDKVPAVLEAWYPGEEDGNAVADVLFGAANPSGKLPITFPKSLGDMPANTSAQYPGIDKVAHYTEGIFVGYRHYDAKGIEPLFPFGFGLSYTKFAYRSLSVTLHPFHSADGSAQGATVEFELANSGPMPGAEVAQVYVNFPSTSAVPQPPKQLKGFQKVTLQPGKETHVSLTLDVQAFSYWDVSRHGWAAMPGRYEILVGSSSRDIRLRKKLEVKFVDAQKQ